MSIKAAMVSLGVAVSAFGLAAPIAPANVTRQAIGSARHVAPGSIHQDYCYWHRGRRVCRPR
jgi:hypothetical protein